MNFAFLRGRQPNPLILWSVLIGAAAGGLAGWVSAAVYVSPELAQLTERLQQPIVVTSTVPQIQIVPVTKTASTVIYPDHFKTRSVSPVIVLAKKTTAVDGIFTPDLEVGRAVALTSDGWLITTYSTFKNLHLADLNAVWQGQSFPIQKALHDTATDAVFLKTAATGLPVAALVNATDLELGSNAWAEPEPGRIFPETVIELRAPLMVEPVSSERAVRRLLVSGGGELTGPGGAVWDDRGQLLGLLETKVDGGWRVLPAADLRASLSSLLTAGEIRHAVLGVRASDLSALVSTNNQRPWPTRGAWLRADKRLNLPAVAVNGPAAKLLKDGDVIERVERDVLDGTADLGERLLDYKPGTQVTLYGTRGTEQFQVTVTLGSQVTGEILK